MTKKLALISRLYSVRSHNNDNEEDGLDEEWVAIRRKLTHNLQMKDKRKAANKAYWEQFEERVREGKHKKIVDLGNNDIQLMDL